MASYEDYSESEIQYQELLECIKDNENIYSDYGLLLAIEQFVEALELVPNDNEAQEELEYTKNLLKDEKAKGMTIKNVHFFILISCYSHIFVDLCVACFFVLFGCTLSFVLFFVFPSFVTSPPRH